MGFCETCGRTCCDHEMSACRGIRLSNTWIALPEALMNWKGCLSIRTTVVSIYNIITLASVFGNELTLIAASNHIFEYLMRRSCLR